MKTGLLGFSGGLDSTVCAIRLKNQGYMIELGYVPWYIEGSPIGRLQNNAANTVSKALGLKLIRLASVTCPMDTQAKWSWVQVANSMVMWHAAYPIMRYDCVAFGQHLGAQHSQKYGAGGVDSEKQKLADEAIFQTDSYSLIECLAHVCNYRGELLFPVDGSDRDDLWGEVPVELHKHLWCCNIPTPDGERCGHCYKCKLDPK